MTTCFRIEQGPIRPPNEAQSLLLRFTRNCPWNRCCFCPVYKGSRFSCRSLEDIKQDIDTVRSLVDDIRERSRRDGFGGVVSADFLSSLAEPGPPDALYWHVACWLHAGEGRVFLQDADSLVKKTKDLVEALRHQRRQVPEVRRVTTYARARTISRKSAGDMRAIHEAGLDRIHVGLESGFDPVLELMRKGVTAAEHARGGRLVKEAGIVLSAYIMPGLGGLHWSQEHARATARVLNEIDADYIRIRSLRVIPSTSLQAMVESGELELLDNDGVVREIRLILESLEGVASTVASDHIMNLLEEVAGTLPRDREHMISVIDRYLGLPGAERRLFRLGRWTGAFRTLDELDVRVKRERIERLFRELERMGPDRVDRFIEGLAERYL